MLDSRCFQYRVFAALQPIANHIHRPADYPVATPGKLAYRKTLSAVSAHPAWDREASAIGLLYRFSELQE
jgi:hypothetical protein